VDDEHAKFFAQKVDAMILQEIERHAPKPSEEDLTLTPDKVDRINRCRLRYVAGYPMSGEDLYVLKATPREVLGVLWQEGMREPMVEGPIAPPPRYGGILNFDVTS